MLDIKLYNEYAQDLSRHVVTDWDGYDFEEKDTNVERRVPKILFKGIGNIELRGKEPEHVEGFGYEKYIRRYEVIYRDRRFAFVVTVDSVWGQVKNYWLTVYAITGEENVKLITERL